MFKFSTIPKKDMDKIRQMKRGSATTKNLDFAGGAPISTFTFPHETYSLGLSALKNAEDFKPKLTGMRVFEAAKDNLNYIYDLNKTEKGSEPHMFMDQEFLKDYENAFSTILGTEMENENYEVRTLKVPALHIEALWLHKQNNEAADKFLPVKSVNKALDNKLYNVVEFLSLLSKMAERYNTDGDQEKRALLGG